MKVLIADPEVPQGVAESLTVAVPVTVEELFSAIIRLYQYPAATTVGRPLDWIRSWTEMFFIFVASCKFKHFKQCDLLFIMIQA